MNEPDYLDELADIAETLYTHSQDAFQSCAICLAGGWALVFSGGPVWLQVILLFLSIYGFILHKVAYRKWVETDNFISDCLGIKRVVTRGVKTCL
jgi:hypothetical protein